MSFIRYIYFFLNFTICIFTSTMPGKRIKSQAPKTNQTKRPRLGQNESVRSKTDFVTIETSTPPLTVVPETMAALIQTIRKYVTEKVLEEMKPLLQHQGSISVHNNGGYWGRKGDKRILMLALLQATSYKQAFLGQIVT